MPAGFVNQTGKAQLSQQVEVDLTKTILCQTAAPARVGMNVGREASKLAKSTHRGAAAHSEP
jgi:hypothetical protein